MAAYRRVYDYVTCRLAAKNRDQLWNLTLGNRVWATFTFFLFDQRVINFVYPCTTHSTVVGVIHRRDRRRVLLTTPTRELPWRAVRSLEQSSRKKYPYF